MRILNQGIIVIQALASDLGFKILVKTPDIFLIYSNMAF